MNEVDLAKPVPPEPEAKDKIVEKTVKKDNQSKNIAVILVRGMVDVNKNIKQTLHLLRLNRKNHCVVVANNKSNLGMLNKIKDYATWGEISDATYEKLVNQRGKEFKARETDGKKKYSYKTLKIGSKSYKPYFRLNPPRKGFGRKGIKMPFSLGGALGPRSEKINDLIERML